MGVEPENTLRSFVRAEQAGMDAIELDLHLSKDGSLVVMHDTEVDRTTDGRGAIAEKTLAELRELDADRASGSPSMKCSTPCAHRSRRRSRTRPRRGRSPM